MRILGDAANESPEEYDELSDKLLAAGGILKTIGTLLLAVDSAPDVLRQLEHVILPVCVVTLEREMIGIFYTSQFISRFTQ